jgi:hypothetical protein
MDIKTEIQVVTRCYNWPIGVESLKEVYSSNNRFRDSVLHVLSEFSMCFGDDVVMLEVAVYKLRCNARAVQP